MARMTAGSKLLRRTKRTGSDPRELGQRVALLTPRIVLEEPRERRLGDLADVDIAARVHPEAVRRSEAVRRTRIGAAPGREDVPVDVADGQPRGAVLLQELGGHVARALLPAHLTDVDGAVRRDEQVAGPGDLGPDGQRLAGR